MTELVLTIVAAVLGSSALFAFLQFIIQRKDNKEDKEDTIIEKIDGLASDIKNLSDKIDRNQATQARVRILRAGDELRQSAIRSSEYYRQLNEDITNYEQYCSDHPDYRNNQATLTIQYINDVYQKCLKEDTFL